MERVEPVKLEELVELIRLTANVSTGSAFTLSMEQEIEVAIMGRQITMAIMKSQVVEHLVVASTLAFLMSLQYVSCNCIPVAFFLNPINYAPVDGCA